MVYLPSHNSSLSPVSLPPICVSLYLLSSSVQEPSCGSLLFSEPMYLKCAPVHSSFFYQNASVWWSLVSFLLISASHQFNLLFYHRRYRTCSSYISWKPQHNTYWLPPQRFLFVFLSLLLKLLSTEIHAYEIDLLITSIYSALLPSQGQHLLFSYLSEASA